MLQRDIATALRLKLAPPDKIAVNPEPRIPVT
jgi:hypothetical protein